jgi:hypothetical protein
MSKLSVRGIKHDSSALAADNLTLESNGSGVSLRAASDLRLTLGSEGTVGNNTSNWVRAAGQKLMLNSVADFDVETSGTTRLRIQASTGNLQFNSGYGSVANAYGCRAWVNFNGDTTPSIRASGNISSVSSGSTGIYAANFATSMPDLNYCAIGNCGGESGTAGDDNGLSFGTGSGGFSSTSQLTQIRTINVNNVTRYINRVVSIAVFR